MRDRELQKQTEAPDRSPRRLSVHIPELREGLKLQDFSRAILGLSDVARELSALYEGFRTRSPDTILTGHVRQMSVSLRSLLLNNKGRLLDRLFKDDWAPAWHSQSPEVTERVVVDASPGQEVGYTVSPTGESRTLKVPDYKHGFVVGALPGIGKSAERVYEVLENTDIWDVEETVPLKEWVRSELFEVDGLVYDVANCIKCVADKEGAHIDKVVDSEGIYTGNRTNRKVKFTTDDAYLLSRMVKFGPFSLSSRCRYCRVEVLRAHGEGGRESETSRGSVNLGAVHVDAPTSGVDTGENRSHHENPCGRPNPGPSVAGDTGTLGHATPHCSRAPVLCRRTSACQCAPPVWGVVCWHSQTSLILFPCAGSFFRELLARLPLLGPAFIASVAPVSGTFGPRWLGEFHFLVSAPLCLSISPASRLRPVHPPSS